MSSKPQSKLVVLVKRFLDLTWFLFVFLAVVWPVTVLVVGLSISSDPENRHADISVFSGIRIDSGFSSQASTPGENEGGLILKGRGDLILNNTQGQLGWYVSGVISELMLVIFLLGLFAMRKLFTSLSQGNMFAVENAGYIQKLGYVFIAWHSLYPLLQYFGSRIILGDVALSVPGINLYPAFELDVGGIFAGFAIIVLAGVFREAASMHQEQSLTI